MDGCSHTGCSGKTERHDQKVQSLLHLNVFLLETILRTG